MSVESSIIKEILYSQIRATESKIQQEIANKNYGWAIKELLDRCVPEISELDGDSYEIFGTLAESMMHYLLTNALIPSQRKITVKDTDVDVIIPDLRTLESSKKDALVLYFVKTEDQNSILKHLTKLQMIQPAKENILVIAKGSLPIPFKTFEIGNKSNFITILDEISKFVSSRSQTKFRIFKT